jgi:hypothetical protein
MTERKITITSVPIEDDQLKQEITTDGYVGEDVPVLMLDVTYAFGSLLLEHFEPKNARHALHNAFIHQVEMMIDQKEKGLYPSQPDAGNEEESDD